MSLDTNHSIDRINKHLCEYVYLQMPSIAHYTVLYYIILYHFIQ